jgi:hypothetical protein
MTTLNAQPNGRCWQARGRCTAGLEQYEVKFRDWRTFEILICQIDLATAPIHSTASIGSSEPASRCAPQLGGECWHSA